MKTYIQPLVKVNYRKLENDILTTSDQEILKNGLDDVTAFDELFKTN